MDTIQMYLESVFINLPKTDEVKQLKQDVLGNMEDRYAELIDDGVNKNEAIGTVISEFGNIDELIDELSIEQETESDVENTLPVLTFDNAETYLNAKRKIGFFVGLGVAIIILGLSSLLFVISIWGDDAGEMGVGSFLLLAALGIGVIIFGCVGNDNLLPKSFVYENGLKREMDRQKDNYKRSFQLGIALGVMLCVLSVAIIPITAFITNEDEAMMTMSIAIMFAFVAAGVFLFIYVGNVQESYTVLLKKGKVKQPAMSSKKQSNLQKVFQSTWWSLTLVIYLIYSFITFSWATSWIIWIVSGIGYEIIENIFCFSDK